MYTILSGFLHNFIAFLSLTLFMAANKRENFGNKSSEQKRRKKLARNFFSFHWKVLLSLKAQRVSKGNF